MRFVPIFDDEDCLLSVKGDDEEYSEFDKLFRNWTDIEYLDAFFTANEEDLKRPFWGEISIELAIKETRNEAIRFRQYLKWLSQKPPKERFFRFMELFRPLKKDQPIISFLEKKKAYGLRKKHGLESMHLNLEMKNILSQEGQ